MDLLGDPTLQTKYKKSKLRVKLWESDFMEKYGRRPNKNDIREADTIIRDAYKMYWKLKTRALEETLMDITFSDDIQSNIPTTSLSTLILENHCEDGNDSLNTENQNPTTLTPRKEIVFEAVSSEKEANVDGVWGEHLNKEKKVAPKKKQNLLVGRSSSFQLSQEMFKSTSFTKRNPRKSLSMNKSKSKSDLSSSIKETTASQPEDGFDPSEIMKPMFGDQVKIVQEESKVSMQSVSAVHQLIQGQTANVCRKINAGWLERCSTQNNVESSITNQYRLSRTSDSGVESLESTIHSPNAVISSVGSQNPIPFSDDEDFICNSDSEGERQNKRIRNIRRDFNSGECQTTKRQCVENWQTSTSHQSSQNFTVNNPPMKNDSHLSVLPNTKEKEEAKPSIPDSHDLEASKIDEEEAASSVISVPDKITHETSHNLTQDSAAKLSPVKQLDQCVPKAVPAGRNRRKVYRRIQGDSFDDSEAETIPDKKIEKTTRKTRVSRSTNKQPATKLLKGKIDDLEAETIPDKKIDKARKARVTRNTNKQPATKSLKGKKIDDLEAETIPDNKIEKITRKTRVTRSTNKQSATKSLKGKKQINDLEAKEKNVQTEPPDIQIYGVDTVNAVPRFELPKIGSGDLVADFSQIISSKDSKEIEGVGNLGPKTKMKLTDKEKLEKKIASGNINENFVRINLKKKIFVRGKKTMTFGKYKKNQWKQKKKELASGEGGLDLADLVEKKGVLTCFKCGDIGHFSRECKALKSDKLLPLIGDEGPSEYPTLDEAAKMASENLFAAHKKRLNLIPQAASGSIHSTASQEETNEDALPGTSNIISESAASNENITDDMYLDDLDFTEDLKYEDSASASCGHKIPEDLLAKLLPPETGPIEPLYPRKSSGELSVTPAEVFEALKNFGYESFRPGQEKAVMRILSGQSTLVTLSTGSGKSLCYQLPAYLYAKHSRCITLVISPLVSLMDDQVTGVPKFLSAACLHTAQGAKQRTTVMDKVKEGTLDILLVSPEAVVAGEKSTGFGALLRQLPPIAFACIDEAHCISQWSHNFRPSYLMVCKVLREKLGVKTVLGLTATATKLTAESIVNHLSIPDGMAGVISDIPLPRNLTLTASKDEYKDRALITLLESDRFKDLDSIIVYCTRRDECVRLAGLLRTSLYDHKVHSKVDEKVSSIAEAYHAGLSAHRRKIVQKAFMSGATRIVVATVAFGMGINKPDIRAVIHFNMPSSFEGYVQEVGRSGRDGLPAHCHLFISSKELGDKAELRRHVYANGVDRHMIRRLLQKVFVPCSCTKPNDRKANKRCPGHEVAIPVDDIVNALDIPQEIISTLLCYLELHPKKFITNLSSVYVNAKVTSYNGPKALKAAAQSSPPLAMAIALDMKKGISHDDSSIVEFPVVDVAAAIGWDSGVVKGHLKELEWKTTESGGWKRTPISVTFDTLGFRVRAPGDLSNTELDEALEILTDRTSSQQRMNLSQLEAIYSALTGVALDSVRQCRELTEDIKEKSLSLKTTIREYFQSENPLGKIDLKLEDKLSNEAQIASDVRSLVQCYRDNNFTGRAVARIFHGIQSPNFPALVWSRCRFWRAHLSANFELICLLATREILAMR